MFPVDDSIPQTEAIRMSNGRLACMICPRTPVFDTVAVLRAHRAGKKHQNVLRELASAMASSRSTRPEPPSSARALRDSSAGAPNSSKGDNNTPSREIVVQNHITSAAKLEILLNRVRDAQKILETQK
eukprot:Rmarinus@m.23517